jgi:hypothetical protein
MNKLPGNCGLYPYIVTDTQTRWTKAPGDKGKPLLTLMFNCRDCETRVPCACELFEVFWCPMPECC